MKFYVTEEDIKNGIQCRCCQCPVSLAVKRHLPGTDVMIWMEKIYIDRTEFNNPLIVQEFIRAFDAGKPVNPFSFNLNYEPKS